MLPWVAVETLSSVFQSFVKCVLSFLKYGVCLVRYYYMSELEVPCLAFAPLIEMCAGDHSDSGYLLSYLMFYFRFLVTPSVQVFFQSFSMLYIRFSV